MRVRRVRLRRCERLLARGPGSTDPLEVQHRAEHFETGTLDLVRHGLSGSSILVPPADSAKRVVNPLAAFRSGSAQRRVFAVGG